MVSIEGEAMRSVTWVVVEEVASGDWGIGGNALTTEDVKALQAACRSAEQARNQRLCASRGAQPRSSAARR